MKTETQNTVIRKSTIRRAGLAALGAIALGMASLLLFSGAEAKGLVRRGVVAGCGGGSYFMPEVGDEVVVNISLPPSLTASAGTLRTTTTLDMFLELDTDIWPMPRRTVTIPHLMHPDGEPEQFALRKKGGGWDVQCCKGALTLSNVFDQCQPPIPPGASVRRVIMNVSTTVEDLPKGHPGVLGCVQLFGSSGEPKSPAAFFHKLGEL